ncbi:hypothetical protein BDF19DRAFT_486166 [Syncephalis fuscata]|nr:hypothetical protein BDF19DRAFT_486166 [Syncephalis fuscata]
MTANKSRCPTCGKGFPSLASRRKHDFEEHKAQINVWKGEDGRFGCPFKNCTGSCATTEGFKKHLKKHEAYITYFEMENKEAQVGAKRLYQDDKKATSFKNSDDDVSLFTKKKQKIGKELYSTPTPTHSTPLADASLSYDDAILSAFNALQASPKCQQKAKLVAKSSKLHPLSLTTGDGRSTFHVLAVSEAISRILFAQPKGEIIAPLITPSAADNACLNSSKTADNRLRHCLQHGLFGEKLKQCDIIEMNDEIAELLQRDWHIWPQMRYVSAQLFSNAILVEDKQILLINCVEAYGRRCTIDVHHETAWRSPSVPDDDDLRYNGIKVVVDTYNNSKRLLIGTHSSNLLVTSSVLLRNNQQIIQLGPVQRTLV